VNRRTKDDLILAVSDRCGFSRRKSEPLVESILELIKKALESGEDVLISGFGKFWTGRKARRKGRNPATGKDLMLRSRKVVKFKCSTVLRDKINERR
jgi:integration host factor subunit alpha